ncbi:MAG: 4-alpha-glucanotransferase, partial [Lachnospiraceae bacterium]|nr:4-alpha-glucanotransferase [Lachnospiraceae bacterium]
MRASGILLPIFSLPGKYGIGCFSKEAYDFVDFLAAAKQKYWQILPVGPTSYGDSPYQSFSTFAGNPYFIDLEKLIEQGLLTREECDKTNFGTRDDDIDYGQMYIARFKVLRQAFAAAKDKLDENFRKFIKENDFWIQDYALFMAIKDANGGKSFYQWEEGLRRHDDKALEKFTSKHEQEVTFYQWLQYEFYTQWYALKA